MDITISDLTPDDYNRVMTVWNQCDGIGLSGSDSEENIRSFLGKNPGMSFIAKVGDRIVGAVLCGHDGRRGHIYHLGVHPDYRHQGIGRTLSERCLCALKEAKIERCHLFVYNDNVEGIQFWMRTGWRLRSELSIATKDIEPDNGGEC